MKTTYSPLSTKVETELSLFDRVKARYAEELEKLQTDRQFNLHYIGIREAGDEIHVWVILTDDHSKYVRNKLSEIRSITASEILPLEVELFTSFRYLSEDGPHYPPKYTPLYPQNNVHELE